MLKVKAIIIIAVSLCLLSAYNIIGVFLDHEVTFRSTTIVALYLNAFCVIFILYINRSDKYRTILNVVYDKFQIGEDADPDRESYFEEEIEDKRLDDKYFPTKREVFELFTLANYYDVPKAMNRKLFKGIDLTIAQTTKSRKLCLSAVLYIVGVIFLLANAVAVYFIEDGSYLGGIVLATIVLTDIILLLHCKSMILEKLRFNQLLKTHKTSPLITSMHVIVIRALCVVFGLDNWIYGYCLLYLYVTTIASLHILKLMLPYSDQLANYLEKRKADDIVIPKRRNPIFVYVIIILFTAV